MIEAEWGEPLRLDEFQVPAAAFYVEDVLGVTDEAGLADFDRGIAAAVLDKSLVVAEEPGGVDALGEGAGGMDDFDVVPGTFNKAPIMGERTDGVAS